MAQKMADNEKKSTKTPLGTDVPEQQADPAVRERIQSETPHGIVDLANAGGNAPIDANALTGNPQPPLHNPTDEGETGFTDIGGNDSAGPGGSIHNFAGGGNMKTSPVGAYERDTRDLNEDVIPAPNAAEVGGARGNQPDADLAKEPGEQRAPRTPSRIQDPIRERKAS